MPWPTHPEVDADEDLSLPALDVATEDEDVPPESADELKLPVVGAATDDEAPPIDLFDGEWIPELPGELGEPDDQDGPSDAAGTDALVLEIGAGSLLDDEADSAPWDDETVGVEPMPDAGERTDRDGLDDPAGDRVVDQPLPLLDHGDDEQVDVGIEIEPLAEPAASIGGAGTPSK